MILKLDRWCDSAVRPRIGAMCVLLRLSAERYRVPRLHRSPSTLYVLLFYNDLSTVRQNSLSVPPSVETFNSTECNNLIIFLEERPQTLRVFAAFLNSTPYDTVRHFFVSSCLAWCQAFSPCCRGPPLLKSRILSQF